MIDFLTSDFWEDTATHVALAPGQQAEGLAAFMESGFGRRGWCLFQTSGTEGARKWAGLTKESLLISARAVNAHFDVTKADRWLLALPVWHVGGFGILARAFASGCAVTGMESRWDAALFAHGCENAGATLASLVPAQVFDLVAAGLRAPDSMRAVLVGGGALSREIEAAALKLGWPLRKTYGMTETCSQVASQYAAGGEMELLPIWHASTDETGALTLRGNALAQGYAAPEEEAWRWEPIPACPGLRTRDRVTLWNEEGRTLLRFEGREAGTVKILGELVALGPIQERIDALRLELGLRLGDAAVCDVPDERGEARLLLAVCDMGTADAERMKNGLNTRLRPFEKIAEVRRLDVIPRGALGKTRLEELRQQITSTSELSRRAE